MRRRNSKGREAGEKEAVHVAKGKYQQWITTEGSIRIEGWARDGLTDEQIAKNMGIRRETLIEWKKRFPNISNALKRSKELADLEVENALFKSAIGFVGPDEKYYPPNITAQIFWLKNRKPAAWRDKPVEIENDEDTGIIMMPPIMEEPDA